MSLADDPAIDTTEVADFETGQPRAREEVAFLDDLRYQYARLNKLMTTEPFERPPYAGDCGLDLAITQDVIIHPGEMCNVPCGVKVALPLASFGWICGRSSTWSSWGLQVMPGIIDEGWRGELRTMIYRPLAYPDSRPPALMIPRGTRLAQLIVLPNLLGRITIEVVDELPPGSRGEKGFGSSG